MLSGLWERCHKMLYEYRPQHWLSVSASLLTQLFICLKLHFTATNLFTMLHVIILLQWLENTAIINIGNYIVNLMFIMLLSCRWYKWLPPTSLIQHRILPGTNTGKQQTHHMLAFTQHLHTDISVFCILIEFLFIGKPNSNFITSHVIIYVCKCSRILLI